MPAVAVKQEQRSELPPGMSCDQAAVSEETRETERPEPSTSEGAHDGESRKFKSAARRASLIAGAAGAAATAGSHPLSSPSFQEPARAATGSCGNRGMCGMCGSAGRLRQLLKLTSVSVMVVPFDHRVPFRRAVFLAKSGGEGREHQLQYLEIWILVLCLILGTNAGTLGLVPHCRTSDYCETRTLLDQLLVITMSLGVLQSFAAVICMTVLLLNVSACSDKNFRAFSLLAEGMITFNEGLIVCCIYCSLTGYLLLPIVVLSDPATLPVAVPLLNDGRLYMTLFGGLGVTIVPLMIRNVNALCLASFHGMLMLASPVLADDVVSQGRTAVTNALVGRVLARHETVGGISDAQVLQEVWQAGHEARRGKRPALKEMCETFQKELGVSGDTISGMVEAACLELGVDGVLEAGTLSERAWKCWVELMGDTTQEEGDDNINGGSRARSNTRGVAVSMM